jgi:hypothetical protein
LLGIFRHRFALLCQRLKGGANVDEAFDPFSQFVHVWHGAGTASANGDRGMALIPIDAVGLDDIVENPALIVEAFNHGLALGAAMRPVTTAHRVASA